MKNGKSLIKKFGKMVHETRMEKRISQKDLSEAAGISDVYLRGVEGGQYTPTWVIWLKLCTALDIDIPTFQREYILPELEVHHISEKPVNNRKKSPR